jgi:hypothetical protein
MTVLKKITTRAKQIYKKGKAGISWVAAIKRASVQVKGKTRQPAKRKRKRIGSVAKGPRSMKTVYTVPVVSGIKRKVGTTDGFESADFWLKMFAPRTKKQQRAFYTMIKKELKTGKISVFSTVSQRKAQYKALQYLLGYSQSL